jgi:hypothetical protein
VENYNIETLVKNQWIPMLLDLQEELIPPTLTEQKENSTIPVPVTT